jgi:AAA+ ATPase superfamily predicted ATPase
MDFLDREPERRRLDQLLAQPAASFGVVYGRRRIGKTRLLLEWALAHDGVYTVADRSDPVVQRAFFASSLARRLPGLADARWPDWAALLSAVARGATAAGWRGPLVVDELPYLVEGSPELPSVLQRWLDHEARAAGLVVAVAGSSRHLMQGLVLDASAPLFGRAGQILSLGPLPLGWASEVVPGTAADRVAFGAAFGGVPRYWELAVGEGGDLEDQLDALVLDPLGPLHDEPARLLQDEVPSADSLRPYLDVLGLGASRVSEIGARLERPTSSMARPLSHLVDLGYVRREVPFGEDERSTRRTLYRLADPFLRLWFRVVAPHRAALAVLPAARRRELLARAWPGLLGESWEELCRDAVPRLPAGHPVARRGPWGPARRWWHGAAPEWDVVAESLDGRRLLLGEVKVGRGAAGRARTPPPFASRYEEVVSASFVLRDPRAGDVGPDVVLAALR